MVEALERYVFPKLHRTQTLEIRAGASRSAVECIDSLLHVLNPQGL